MSRRHPHDAQRRQSQFPIKPQIDTAFPDLHLAVKVNQMIRDPSPSTQVTPQQAADWFTSAEPLTFSLRDEGLETVHAGHGAVVDSRDGQVVLSVGDPTQSAFPRSSLKFIQALGLVESGAADHFALGAAQLALSCASHHGEALHVETVLRWLAQIGCHTDELVCGPARPKLDADRERRAVQGAAPAREVHNCSGKHTGFLTLCQYQGWSRTNYHHRDHPAQQYFEDALLSLSGCSANDLIWGVDGCGLPTPSLPVEAMARAMAGYATPDASTVRGQAQARLVKAVVEEPWYIAGTDDFSVALARETRGRIVAKVGAAGYFMAVIRDRGWGLALKMLDGSMDVAAGGLFTMLQRLHLLSEDESQALRSFALPIPRNSQGEPVGHRHAIL